MSAKTAGAILVAVDGSQVAQNAAAVAIHLARIRGYGIHALYVVDEALTLEAYSDYRRELTFPLGPDDDENAMTLLETQGALALNQVMAMAGEAEVPIETEMLLGNVTDMILERAKDKVMVALGRRGNRHADHPDQLGAHFRQVAHKTTAPLIAGGDVVPQQIRRLLFGFSGDEHDIKALHGLTVLQRDLNAEVIVVLGEGADETQVQAWIAEADRAYYRFVRRPEKLVEALPIAAAEEKADLIVMSERHRRLALLDDLLGSPLEEVLKKTPLPVIIVR